MRPRVLFRGDDPGRADAARREDLVCRLGIRHVVDLRHDNELRKSGLGAFVSGKDVVRHHMPLSMAPVLLDGRLPTTGEELGNLYARSLAFAPQTYARVIRLLAEVEEPVLIHCNQGKDRTGAVVGLVLWLLGAEAEDIVADFARTTDNLPMMCKLANEGGFSIGLSRFASQPGAVLDAPPEAMWRFLDVLRDASTAGLPSRLTDTGLLPGDVVSRLRSRLIER